MSVDTGNTILPPPRINDDPVSDMRAVGRWLQGFYDQVVKRNNVQGTIANHETRIAALETENATLKAQIAALDARVTALEP